MQPSHLLAPVDAPRVSLQSLDTVWFQVGGTICNLRCDHCFISCSPENDKFHFMSLETCRKHLADAVQLGAKEFYFTGGEPFANPEMCDILAEALRHGPATVLTNATLFRESTLRRLRRMKEAGLHALEIRVSLDGYTAEMNDPIRGAGTFDRAMEGIRQLVSVGIEPIITITRTWCGCDEEVLAGFVATLKTAGYKEPRLKLLPLLRLGAERERTRSYNSDERVTHEMMQGYDASQLLCTTTRLVTNKGVWVCPILLDSAEARMGESLSDAMGDYPLRHNACHTCWRYGPICSNETTCASTPPSNKQA